jgi:hypothetical protein
MRTPLAAFDFIQRPLHWTDSGYEAARSDIKQESIGRQAICGDEVARLDESYRPSGGLVTSSDVLAMLRVVSDQPLSLLARWIVDRQVVHFIWRAQTFLPLGQFDKHTMQVRHSWVEAVRCLGPGMDDWEVAKWFAKPHPLLDGAIPADAIRRDPAGVARLAASIGSP